MEKTNKIKMPVEEKGNQPQVYGAPCIETRNTYKIRWITIVFTVLFVALLFHGTWKKYTDWNHTFENIIYKTNKPKGIVRVFDVNRLKFHKYVRDFGKVYYLEEYHRRFRNFKRSLKEIARLNRLENNTVFGLTKFSDMSKKEFAKRILSKSIPLLPSCHSMMLNCTDSLTPHGPAIRTSYRNNIRSSFDWRNEAGVVKPVLNQKLCQGCWAFGIIGVMESMSAIQLKDYESRSIQQLLDCSPDTDGCNRGNVVTAMKYLCDRKVKITTEKEYPLDLGIDKQCRMRPQSGRRVKAFWHYCDMDVDKMVVFIATHGPLVVTVDSRNWRNYIGGVITRACTRGVPNHVVQIVGYKGFKSPDAETPIPYYIVRNSFGEDFGEHGYLKIAMNGDVCGIAERVTIMEVL